MIDSFVGKVKIGTHVDTGQKVAIKIIKKELIQAKPAMAFKIQREIGVMKLVKHNNVVELYNVYETAGHLCVENFR